ncbi:hypothetical protein K8I85_05175 [bacterium]|nr:hypothetical protein [bacterium]
MIGSLAMFLCLASSATPPGAADARIIDGDWVRVWPCEGPAVTGEWSVRNPDSVHVVTRTGAPAGYSLRETCRLDLRKSRALPWMKTGAVAALRRPLNGGTSR